MKRWIAVTVALVFIAGCSGIGGSGNRLLPGIDGLSPDTHRENLRAYVTMRIPRHHRGEREPMHPSTISPFTESVGIAVNGGHNNVFDTTPASPDCSIGNTGTTCTFAIAVRAGNDTFVVSTYSGAGGTGVILNRGTAVIAIAKGKTNSVHVSLGIVVSTTADSGQGSLRYAIGSANPGDTVMFTLAAGTTITVATPITLNTNVSIAGPGVTASTRVHRTRRGIKSNTTFSGITISGGGAHQVFVVNAGVTATISGLIVTDGSASVLHHPGGAISNLGTLTLTGDAITDSTSLVTTLRTHRRAAILHPHCTTLNEYGGGVYNNGTLTITGSTFDSNVVSNVNACSSGFGGAIYNDQYGTLTSTGNTYSNNGGYEGGAVYNNSTYGQAFFTNDKFVSNFGCAAANGCATTGCVVASSCSNYAQGDGGAIYDNDGPGITVTSSTFTGNVVGGDSPDSIGEGGALYLGTGAPLLAGSTFVSNEAGGGTSNCSDGEGGAIYESAAGALEIDADTFTNNFAGGDSYGRGGAIYNNSNADRGSDDTFTGNVTFGNGSDCATSNETGIGGAIYANYGLNLSNSAFSSNVATGEIKGEGGAIYENAASVLSGDTFTSNSVVGTSVNDDDSYGYGAAIYNGNSLKVSNSTFTSNSAQCIGPYGHECYGGAIYDSGGLTSSNDTFSSNTASTDYPDNGYVDGAAIYGSAVLSSTRDTFKSNKGTSSYEGDGGAIYNTGITNLSGDTFTSNAITGTEYAYGGAAELDAGNSTVENSTFSGNTAGTGTQEGYGGGVYLDQSAVIGGSTFSGNTATSGGGGLYDAGGAAIISSSFTGNTVSAALPYYGGGGIYEDSSEEIEDSTISGNTVNPIGLYAGGGGIYVDSSVALIDSTVSGNTTTGNLAATGGGGIFNYKNLAVANSTITGNSSTTNGGGLFNYNSGGNALLANATIYQNKAAGSGGNIENDYTLIMDNTIAAGGSAATGLDVDNPGTLTEGDYNLIQAPVTGNATGGTKSNDILGKDPKLLALANNGGPTYTNADQASTISPGTAYITWSAASNGTCGNVTDMGADQRGYTRGAGLKCDIGAYEFSGAPSAIRPHFKHPNWPNEHYRHHHTAAPPFKVVHHAKGASK